MKYGQESDTVQKSMLILLSSKTNKLQGLLCACVQYISLRRTHERVLSKAKVIEAIWRFLMKGGKSYF